MTPIVRNQTMFGYLMNHMTSAIGKLSTMTIRKRHLTVGLMLRLNWQLRNM